MPHSRISSRLRDYARLNRLISTAGEKEMWRYLQSFRPAGARFRRQAPIGNYIADFAWSSARIVVEVDGASHESAEQRERDQRKDAFLRREGFRVFRISGNDVAWNSPQAFAELESAIDAQLSTPPLTPPHKGEGDSGA
jgi:very-short-patch-repair endonuclease